MMACRKLLELRLWLPCTILLATALVTFGYQFLNPQNCANIFFNCTLNSFTAGNTPDPEPTPPPLSSGPRIAVCLVGGARTFELTGRSLRKHLLDAHPNTDVFLHAPLDSDSHKLRLLAGRNLKVAKIFTPTPIPETKVATEVITAWGSPAGLQGLLQYFNLVEGCYGMVKKYEVRRKIRYDWIVRTRMDGYWRRDMGNLSELDPGFYHVAAGSDFDGLNDRFGVGSQNTSRAASARLSLLALMHARGYRGLNSESAYKAQLDVAGVPYKRVQVPFCVMSRRKMFYPPPPRGLLVLSMASRGDMSGSYCRPCEKEANASYSVTIVDGCTRSWDWPGIDGSQVIVCNGRKPWVENWRDIARPTYMKDMGEEIPIFKEKACVSEMRKFERMWEVWDSPSAETICKRALSSGHY